MKILHYSLGLPPYRTGGLTKYCFDLMKEQISMSLDVYLLYPGRRIIFNKKVSMKKNKKQLGINIYELVNPMPVPLLGGVRKPTHFYEKTEKSLYIDFLEELNPDIIHVHTVMGIHKEFFIAAKELKIKIVFTTHDYYGICPKVNLIDKENNVCTSYECGKKCVFCNVNSYSNKLLYIMQLPIYRSFKDKKLIKKLGYYIKDFIKKKKEKNKLSLSNINSKEYENLRFYYIEIFNLIDYFHFNSTVAKLQYEKYFDCIGEVINITHSDIKDNRKIKNFRDNLSKLRITYLGPTEVYKGFYLLDDALKEVEKSGISNWELSIYGNYKEIPIYKSIKNYNFYGIYRYIELKDIFNNTDILIVPSIWKETFGYIGLEAFSHGVPVMLTENVGFKDMIKDGITGIIVSPNKQEMALKLESIIQDRNILKMINNNVTQANFNSSINKHSEKIIQLYNKVLRGSC